MGACGSTKNSDEKQYIKSNNMNNNPNSNNPYNFNKNINNQIEPIKAQLLPKGKSLMLKRINQSNNKREDLKSQVELFIKITGPVGSTNRVQFILKMKTKDIIKNIGSTEISNDNTGCYLFLNSFLVDYFFEIEQSLFFIINSNDNNHNQENEITLGRIIGSKTNTVNISLNQLNVEIKGVKIKSEKEYIKFDFTPVDFKSNTLYYILSNINDGVNWRKVYKSEERQLKNKFDSFEVDLSALCIGDLNKKILIEVYDSYYGRLLSKTEFTIKSFLDSNYGYLSFPDGIKCPTSISIHKAKDFLDYIQSGMQISIIVGVDCTYSNGHFQSPDSLHYLSNIPNEYEQSIEKCGSIISYYDHDQKFPLLGFGAIPPGMKETEHVFPMNLQFNGSPEVGSIQEMLSVYRATIPCLSFNGPTNFAPLINKTCDFSLQTQGWTYTILMILTDGAINDIDDTITAIIRASKLAISIIIVGVGKADFTSMEHLDGDEIPLSNDTGIVERDIVQFVEFRKYKNNINLLAEEVLKEIPKQVEDFMRGKNFNFEV